MTGLRPGEKIQYRSVTAMSSSDYAFSQRSDGSWTLVMWLRRFDGGLRIVDPYIFEFRCGAKGRWFKRGILEVFLNEFGMFPADYYKVRQK